jgi:hypothetical protein
MNYKYRVLGKVHSAFIFRGLHYNIGSNIDLCIEGEYLKFIEDRCNLVKKIDLQAPIEPPKPIQKTPKSNQKGGKK